MLNYLSIVTLTFSFICSSSFRCASSLFSPFFAVASFLPFLAMLIFAILKCDGTVGKCSARYIATSQMQRLTRNFSSVPSQLGISWLYSGKQVTAPTRDVYAPTLAGVPESVMQKNVRIYQPCKTVCR